MQRIFESQNTKNFDEIGYLLNDMKNKKSLIKEISNNKIDKIYGSIDGEWCFK